MPGFLITLLFGGGVFLLHAIAGAPSQRAVAVCDLLAAVLMGLALLVPAMRRAAAKLALRLGAWAFLGIGVGYMMAARGAAEWVGFAGNGAAALGPCLAAIASYSLARADHRQAMLSGLYLASGACALWSSLSFLAVSRGAAPSLAALPLDFTTNPAASCIFAVALALSSFALGEEAVRTPQRNGTRLAPLGQRLILPLLTALSCLLALSLTGDSLPILAGGLGATGVIMGLGLRARRVSGLIWAAMPALGAFALLGLSLARGEAAPWDLAFHAILSDPGWIPVTILVIGASVLAKDRKRGPTRGLGLVLGIGATLLTLAAFSASAHSPSGLFVCALLFGLALSYHDAEAKPARRQKAFGASAGARAS